MKKNPIFIFIIRPVKFLLWCPILLLVANSCIKEPDDLIPYVGQDKWVNLNTGSGLSGNTIYCIKEDSNGNMWFGTDNGITMITPSEQIINYNQSSGLLGMEIYAIEEIYDGTMFFGTNRGLTLYNGQTFTNYEVIFNEEWVIYDILMDSRKNIWFATDIFGAIYISYQDDNFYQPAYGDCSGCYYANAIFEDSNRNIWISSLGGALKYNYSSLLILTAASGLSTDQVMSIGEDRWGDIWIGPLNGKHVGRYNGQSIRLISLLTDYDTDRVMDITTDKIGNLWFGLVAAGAVKFNGNYMRQLTAVDGLNDPTIMDIYSDSKGNLWFGSLSSGAYKYTPALNQE
jgi:ligand-binding sensor domain-containing protein